MVRPCKRTHGRAQRGTKRETFQMKHIRVLLRPGNLDSCPVHVRESCAEHHLSRPLLLVTVGCRHSSRGSCPGDYAHGEGVKDGNVSDGDALC
jgi:hypothetical protein